MVTAYVKRFFSFNISGLTSGYDIALLRLKCYKEDVFRGVAANEFAADYNPYPPTNACEFCSAPGYEHLLALANEDGKVALQDTAIKSKSQGPLPGTQVNAQFFVNIKSSMNIISVIKINYKDLFFQFN